MNTNLYSYVSDIVGSEQTVEIRRTFFKILEGVLINGNTLQVVVSGSKAEGLDMPGSDLDIMAFRDDIYVYASESDITADRHSCLIIDTENASPGFALLKSLSEIYDYFNSVVETEYGKVLSNEKFKITALQANRHVFFQIHGPCLALLSGTLDIAYCISGQFWPSVAFHWIQRPRLGNWPSADLISEIVQGGVLFVPIGSKFGSSNDNKYEWRISFSKAERMLIHSFNHTQLLCYGMLKFVLKEVINKPIHLKDFLCSYFMKTVVFWIMEEADENIWIPENLLLCFKSCMKRIIYWVGCGYCPNYFIPQNNMFEGKLTSKKYQYLILSKLLELNAHDIHYFIEPLKNFRQLLFQQDIYLGNIVPNSVITDFAIYPLLTALHALPRGTRIYGLCRTFRFHNKGIQFCRQSRLSKQLHILVFAHICRCLCFEFIYSIHWSNKRLYKYYKTLMCYLLVGCNSDLSGWLWIAVFFYQHKQFKNALTATEFALSEFSWDKFIITEYSEIHVKNDTYKFKANLSFLQRYKLSCLHQMYELADLSTFLYKTDLGSGACLRTVWNSQANDMLDELFLDFMFPPVCDRIMALPNIFAYFIRVMCYYHMHDVEKTKQAVNDMETKVDIERILSVHGFKFCINTMMLLFRACLLTNSAEDLKYSVDAFYEWLTELSYACLNK